MGRGFPLSGDEVAVSAEGKTKVANTMPNVTQLSAGESFDDDTGLQLGEGYLTFQSSAGNRIVFNDPAAYTRYRINNPGQFNTTPDSSGSYNEEIPGDN